MTKEDLNFIKDAFSQIIDDIAGNPNWGDAAKAVASDLGTLERKLEKGVTELPSDLDEAAEEYGRKEYSHAIHFWDEGLSKNKPEVMKEDFVDSFKAGSEWMAGQGFSFEDEVYYDGTTPFVKDADFDIIELKDSVKDGDKVIVQIRKKQ